MEGEKILFKKTVSRDDVLFTASVLDEYDDVNYAACGFKSTYYLNRADDHLKRLWIFIVRSTKDSILLKRCQKTTSLK